MIKDGKGSPFRKMLVGAVTKMLYEKKINGNMKRSEESIMPVTAYGFPHHGNRSFTFVQDDALPIFLTTGIDP